MSERQDPFSQIFAAWAKAWEAAGSPDQVSGSALQAFDLRLWFGAASPSMERPLDAILGLPRFAVPMLDRKLLALGGGWLLLLQRNGEHGMMVLRAWLEAYAELVAELNRSAAEGQSVDTGRELLDRWLAILNRKMQGVQRSEDFLVSQRKLMEALLSSRTRERELIELIAAVFDLPTRTELDDAHRSVHDLKREVRALRRELDDLKAERGAAAAPGRPGAEHDVPTALRASRRRT